MSRSHAQSASAWLRSPTPSVLDPAFPANQLHRGSPGLWPSFCPVQENSGDVLPREKFRLPSRSGPYAAQCRRWSAASRIRERRHAAEDSSPRHVSECECSRSSTGRRHESLRAKAPSALRWRMRRHPGPPEYPWPASARSHPPPCGNGCATDDAWWLPPDLPRGRR